MKHSIRSRLLIGLTLVFVAIWLIVIAATYYGARQEIRTLFDTQLEQSAKVATRTLLGLELDAAESETAVGAGNDTVHEQYRKNLAVQVWNHKGELVLRSKNAPLFALSDQSGGFSDHRVADQRWRTFTFRVNDHDLTIIAGEPYSARSYLAQHVVLQTLYPVVFGLPAVILLIWLTVGRSFIPLRRLAGEVRRRDPDNLTPISASDAPREVQPLVNGLNNLLLRLEEKIEKERRFTGDAAHELRTPLAGLRAHAQAAMGARNDHEREQSLTQIIVGIDRATHLVNQLLTLSRFDEAGEVPFEVLDLRSIVTTVFSDLLPLADEKGAELVFDCEADGPIMVSGNRDALYVMMRNLVDNAIRYSPSGTEVIVSFGLRNDRVACRVADGGPGIPLGERTRIMDRFYRNPGTNDGFGSGLGLSIVKRVVELHDGQIELGSGDEETGLTVDIVLDRHTAETSSSKTAVPPDYTKLTSSALPSES